MKTWTTAFSRAKERTIEQIFQESGEPAFRRAEHAALRQLLAESGTTPRVTALGGGAFVQTDNVELLKNAGVPTVFLDGPAEELFRAASSRRSSVRLRRDPEDFGKLYEARRPKYLLASLHIETGGKSVESVASESRRH